MRIVRYLKRKGIKGALQSLYEYKLQKILNKCGKFFWGKRRLQNIIILESHNDFDCNGGAFYNFLLNNGYNEKYKIVWLLKNTIPENLPYNVEAYSLYRPSIRRAYYNAVAKYFLADHTVTDKIRAEQIPVYCGHSSVTPKNTHGKMNVPDSVDYILSASSFRDRKWAYQLNVEYPCKRMIHLGFPCQDVLFSEGESEIGKITNERYSKVIAWMPTFRMGGRQNRNDSRVNHILGIPLLNSFDEYERLNRYLMERNILLIIKIHPMQTPGTVKIKNASNICVLTPDRVKELKIDNYRLLRDIDGMISDYSSIAFDFLQLNRPLAFDFSDLDDYTLGLVDQDDMEMFAGEKIYNFEDLVKFIICVKKEDIYCCEREKIRDLLYKYHDGKSCERLAHFLKL